VAGASCAPVGSVHSLTEASSSRLRIPTIHWLLPGSFSLCTSRSCTSAMHCPSYMLTIPSTLHPHQHPPTSTFTHLATHPPTCPPYQPPATSCINAGQMVHLPSTVTIWTRPWPTTDPRALDSAGAANSPTLSLSMGRIRQTTVTTISLSQHLSSRRTFLTTFIVSHYLQAMMGLPLTSTTQPLASHCS
jgi:hypothetical protein